MLANHPSIGLYHGPMQKDSWRRGKTKDKRIWGKNPILAAHLGITLYGSKGKFFLGFGSVQGNSYNMLKRKVVLQAIVSQWCSQQHWGIIKHLCTITNAAKMSSVTKGTSKVSANTSLLSLPSHFLSQSISLSLCLLSSFLRPVSASELLPTGLDQDLDRVAHSFTHSFIWQVKINERNPTTRRKGTSPSLTWKTEWQLDGWDVSWIYWVCRFKLFAFPFHLKSSLFLAI